jgi:hypothetical protein
LTIAKLRVKRLAWLKGEEEELINGDEDLKKDETETKEKAAEDVYLEVDINEEEEDIT